MTTSASSSSPTVEEFVNQQAALLTLERDAELEQSQALLCGLSAKELSARGLGLHGLVVEGQRTGMYGRTVVTLRPRLGGAELPAHCISNGDIVGLSSSSDPNTQIASGVVTSVTSAALEVSFDEGGNELSLSDDDTFRIVKLANDVTYKRLRNSLKGLEENVKGSMLKNCLFGISTFSPPLQSLPNDILDEEGQIRFLNNNLDDSQREAVRFALLQRELAIIHGPPGTGKTTTVVEVIVQAVRCGNKVLCCAPSNIAVDNLLDRLAKNKKVRVVRLGHPARVHQGLQQYSLDALISSSEQTKIVRDVRQDIDKAVGKLKRTRSKAERSGITRDLKDLRKELHERERKAMKEILSHADVVLATLTTGSPDGPLKHLPENHFDMTVIDECSQALELACWIVLPFSSKTILAGDHCQLPPTILSEEAARKGLSLTLMERVIATAGAKAPSSFAQADVVRMLKVQYRMHASIMVWSSNAFYQGQLRAHDSVEKHLLRDLEGVKDDENTAVPLVLIDTTGCDMYEVETGDEISKANEGEVGLVCIHIEQLITSGVKPEDIAVITPYNLQVELIRLQLLPKYPKLEIRSVDGFQGREKEAVVLSLVRCNSRGEVGFLSESRRLNVAVTRGRRHVAVICSAETVSHDRRLAEFIKYLEEHGEVRSAMQYTQEVEQMELHRPEDMVLTVKDDEKFKAKPSTKPKNKKEGIVKPAPKTAPPQKQRETVTITEAEVFKNAVAIDVDVDHEAEKKMKVETFEKIINDFMASTASTYEFSPDLNSHDRLTIHEIAEKLELTHESVGEGRQRRIVLKKKSDEKTSKEDAKSPIATGSSVTCSSCQNLVPRANIELHKLRCQPPRPNVIRMPAATKQSSKKGGQRDEDEEDLDKLLASFTKLDKVCNYEKCRTKISILGVTCQFCNVRFCLDHSMPEIHGCGDAVRKAARMQVSRDGKIYPGSGRPDLPGKVDPVKKKQLQAKLNKKLGSMEEERKTKKKDK